MLRQGGEWLAEMASRRVDDGLICLSDQHSTRRWRKIKFALVSAKSPLWCAFFSMRRIQRQEGEYCLNQRLCNIYLANLCPYVFPISYKGRQIRNAVPASQDAAAAPAKQSSAEL